MSNNNYNIDAIRNIGSTTQDDGTVALNVTLVSGGGGGSGGAITIADGADVTQGAQADAAASSDTGTFSLVSLLKRSLQHLSSIITALAGTLIMGGNVAHDAADSGNPVKIGTKAYAPDTPPADVAAGDRANLISDLKGRLIVYLATTLDSTNDSVRAVATGAPTIANGQVSITTSSTLLVAARAARRRVIVSNPSGATAIFIGVTGVTTTTGLYIPINGNITLNTTAAIYAITAAGTFNVSYSEEHD